MLKSFDIKAFGKIKDLTIPFNQRVNLIFGQNEAGKSTFMAALSSVLMGFSPSKGENHPYMPWGQDAIALEAEVTEGDVAYRVLRTLKSAPVGLIHSEHSKEKINNQPLPHMQFLSKDVFSAVFTMKHESLNGDILKSKSWQEIKEHFMFALAQDQIQSPSKVLDLLENQKRSLLKQDNKGSQKIKVLQKELKDSQSAIHQAVDGFEAYEKRVLQLESLNKRYATLKTKRQALQLEKDQLDLVLPIKRLTNQLLLLCDQYPLLQRSESLKMTIERHRTRLSLQESLRQWNEQLTEEQALLDGLSKRRPYLTAEEEVLLSDRGECDALVKAVDEAKSMQIQMNSDQESLQTTDTYSRLEFLEIFQLEYEDQFQPKILEMNISEVAQHFQIIRLAKQQMDEPVIESKFNGWALLFLMGLLLSLVCVYVLMGSFEMGMTISVLGLIGGVFAMGIWVTGQHQATKKWQTALKAKEVSQKLVNDTSKVLMDLLSPFIRDERQILLLGDGFIHQLIQLRTLFQKKEGLTTAMAAVVVQLKAAQNRLEDFECRHHLKLHEAAQQLDSILIKQQQIIAFEDKCQYIRQRIQEFQEKVSDTLRNLHAEYVRIEQNLGIPYQSYLDNEAFHIDSLNRYDDLVKEKDKLSVTLGASSIYDQWSLEDVVNRKALVSHEIEDSMLQEERLHGDIRAEESECRHLREKDDYLELVAKGSAIEIALEDAKEEYTRLSILIELIRYTDEIYKSMYQPQYLKQASFYFRAITHNRYTEIIIDDRDQVLLVTADQDMPLEAIHSLSSGTLNQLYFSLFLSLTDTLDPECLLPLCLDDVFLSWDYERFLAGVDIIRQLADKRQIFLLSCHQHVMHRLEEAFQLKAFVLEL